MEYGLTANGFVVKPLQQILKEEQEAFVLAFGSDIDISDDSVAGAYIGNRAAKITQLWELLEGLYWAGDRDAASGVYLDRLAALVSVFRSSAKSTKVYECLWGNKDTVINAGHIMRLKSGEESSLRTKVTISANDLLGVHIGISEVSPSYTYSFVINDTTISFVSGVSMTKEGILAGLLAELEELFTGKFVTENQGDDGAIIHAADGIQPFRFSTTCEKINVERYGAFAVYYATNPGPLFVYPESLTEIGSNVSGLDHAINYTAGVTGRLAESDAEVRVNMGSQDVASGSNEPAIEAAVKEVSNVEFAKVYSNRTNGTVDGRPPHSFETVVYGGDDEDIALAIFGSGPAGIEPYGTTRITVYDDENNPWVIGFTRPTPRYIWMKINAVIHDEEIFPVDGTAQIKSAVVAYGIKNITVGRDVLYQRFGAVVFQVEGISTVGIRIAVTEELSTPDDSAYQEANVAISSTEIAMIDVSRIEVIVQ